MIFKASGLKTVRIIRDDFKTDLFGNLMVIVYAICFLIMMNVSNTIINWLAAYSAEVFDTIGIYYLCEKTRSILPYNRYILKLEKETLGIYAFHWNILFAMKLGDFTEELSFIHNGVLISVAIAIIWLIFFLPQ